MMMSTISSFTGFEIDKILSENTREKSVAICGQYNTDSDRKKAVILAEKQPIDSHSLQTIFSPTTRLTLNFQNDIYSQYSADTDGIEGSFKLTTIFPATDKHIIKYSDQLIYMIRETPADYELITKPHVELEALSLQWVYNILEGKSEKDRVIYNDADPLTGFVLLPDLKWNSTDINSLYFIAIVRKNGLASLRDLTSEHLPLLKNISTKGKEAIERGYGITGDQLRLYIHYQPSFYHLHIHFTHIKYEPSGTVVGRAHLLDDVIDNIENIDGLYYRKRTLHFMLKEHDKLLEGFRNISTC